MAGGGARRAGRPWGELKGDDPGLHEFARHLRGLVDRSGQSLRVVAQRCGCGSTTVSKRLNGAELPSWEFVATLVETCVADPNLREKRKSQLRALWQRASVPPGRPPVAAIAPDPRSMVLAAQQATIDAQRQLLDVHDRLHDAHRQLLDSQRAERRTAQMVWVLYWALGRAFQLVGDLTRQRDRTARLASGGNGLEAAQHQLDAAHDARGRTQRQLERAESDHARAVGLAEAAARKVATLRAMLTDNAGRPDTFPPEVAGDDPMGIDELADLTRGLDRMEHLLEAQEGELTRLDQEINGLPTPVMSAEDEQPVGIGRAHDPSTAAGEPTSLDAARLLEIATNPDISPTHRLKACSSLATLGPSNHDAAASACRSMIFDRSVSNNEKGNGIYVLGRLGDPYRREAAAIVHATLDDGELDDVSKVNVLRWYHLIGDDERHEAATHSRLVALDESVEPLPRVFAAALWLKCLPDAAPRAVAVLRQIKRLEGISEVAEQEADRIIREVTTDPWAEAAVLGDGEPSPSTHRQ